MTIPDPSFKLNPRFPIQAEARVCLHCALKAQKMCSFHLFAPSNPSDTSASLPDPNRRFSHRLNLGVSQPPPPYPIPIGPLRSRRFSPIHF